jgi:hypothetical protein
MTVLDNVRIAQHLHCRRIDKRYHRHPVVKRGEGSSPTAGRNGPSRKSHGTA